MWREMSDVSGRDELLVANRALLVLHSSRTAAHELNNVFQMIGGGGRAAAGEPGTRPDADPAGGESRAQRSDRPLGSRPGASRRSGSSLLDLAELTNQALDTRFEHRRAGLSVATELPPGIRVRTDPRDLVPPGSGPCCSSARRARGWRRRGASVRPDRRCCRSVVIGSVPQSFNSARSRWVFPLQSRRSARRFADAGF
jgi:hypothetical protein